MKVYFTNKDWVDSTGKALPAKVLELSREPLVGECIALLKAGLTTATKPEDYDYYQVDSVLFRVDNATVLANVAYELTRIV